MAPLRCGGARPFGSARSPLLISVPLRRTPDLSSRDASGYDPPALASLDAFLSLDLRGAEVMN